MMFEAAGSTLIAQDSEQRAGDEAEREREEWKRLRQFRLEATAGSGGAILMLGRVGEICVLRI
jgi:hypothetical protein